MFFTTTQCITVLTILRLYLEGMCMSSKTDTQDKGRIVIHDYSTIASVSVTQNCMTQSEPESKWVASRARIRTVDVT